MISRQGVSDSAARLRFVATLLILMYAASDVVAQSNALRPLPPPVLSQAPGIRPLGKGRHSYWGIQMYDATLWIVGPRWSESQPHALDIEPNKAVSSDVLISSAVAEMRSLKVGDERKLRAWQAEMKQVIPNLQPRDQVVIFCSDANHTIVYVNDKIVGKVDDPSFCPAVMSVWLHPQTKHQSMRKSLLKQ